MYPDYQNTPLEEPIENSPKERPFLNFLIDVLETLILSVVLFFLINALSARIKVDGSSMEPTLHNGEFILVSKVGYKLGEPERGDVVVFDFPRNITQEYIKRVIGLPGEHIRVDGGQVYVDGQPVTEPYIQAAPMYQGDWDVPEGMIFVLGDNRNNSSDSHNWGMVPMENLVGKALFIYWPPEYWGSVNQASTVSASD
ncbi:MAG: signal peptidase I [Anaerolineaceae bacterium 4572_5.1]|nr:MAG: signal peptidase I [Anaerolineaceae bacterium 4572_5.1]